MPERPQILIQEQNEQMSALSACVSRLKLLTYAAVKIKVGDPFLVVFLFICGPFHTCFLKVFRILMVRVRISFLVFQ